MLLPAVRLVLRGTQLGEQQRDAARAAAVRRVDAADLQLLIGVPGGWRGSVGGGRGSCGGRLLLPGRLLRAGATRAGRGGPRPHATAPPRDRAGSGYLPGQTKRLRRAIEGRGRTVTPLQHPSGRDLVVGSRPPAHLLLQLLAAMPPSSEAKRLGLRDAGSVTLWVRSSREEGPHGGAPWAALSWSRLSVAARRGGARAMEMALAGRQRAQGRRASVRRAP